MKLSARRSPSKVVVNKSGLSSNLSARSEYLSVYQTWIIPFAYFMDVWIIPFAYFTSLIVFNSYDIF